MNNFYGKRFLSSLLGALSVLSSPVASARDDKLGKGNLEGKVGSSARHDKNNGKLGELESNREVKSVDGLKKVLEETGGKVVGVSPDGKGGFVAFIKTPTGAVVALAIVSVPLAVIISCLVCFGRKNGESIKDGCPGSEGKVFFEEVVKDGETKGIIKVGNSGGDSEESIKSKEDKEVIVLEGPDGSVDGGQLKYSGELLKKLFKDVQNYNLFVDSFFEFFINCEDFKNVFRSDFYGDLEKFWKSVFEKSSFDNDNNDWYVRVDGVNYDLVKRIVWGGNSANVAFKSGLAQYFFEKVFDYLSGAKLVEVPKGATGQVNWVDKISSLLFGFWYSVEFGSKIEDLDVNLVEKMESKDPKVLRGAFETIRSYLKEIFQKAKEN